MQIDSLVSKRNKNRTSGCSRSDFMNVQSIELVNNIIINGFHQLWKFSLSSSHPAIVHSLVESSDAWYQPTHFVCNQYKEVVRFALRRRFNSLYHRCERLDSFSLLLLFCCIVFLVCVCISSICFDLSTVHKCHWLLLRSERSKTKRNKQRFDCKTCSIRFT